MDMLVDMQCIMRYLSHEYEMFLSGMKDTGMAE